MKFCPFSLYIVLPLMCPSGSVWPIFVSRSYVPWYVSVGLGMQSRAVQAYEVSVRNLKPTHVINGMGPSLLLALTSGFQARVGPWCWPYQGPRLEQSICCAPRINVLTIEFMIMPAQRKVIPLNLNCVEWGSWLTTARLISAFIAAPNCNSLANLSPKLYHFNEQIWSARQLIRICSDSL